MEEIEEAYKTWVYQMKNGSPSKIFDAKHDLIQRVREQYDDPTERTWIFDKLLEAAIAELDNEEAS